MSGVPLGVFSSQRSGFVAVHEQLRRRWWGDRLLDDHHSLAGLGAILCFCGRFRLGCRVQLPSGRVRPAQDVPHALIRRPAPLPAVSLNHPCYSSCCPSFLCYRELAFGVRDGGLGVLPQRLSFPAVHRLLMACACFLRDLRSLVVWLRQIGHRPTSAFARADARPSLPVSLAGPWSRA